MADDAQILDAPTNRKRFATINEDQLKDIISKKDAVNTQKTTNSSVKLFRTYLSEKGLNTEFETYNATDLDSTLSKFFAEVRQENGELYKKSSLISIRHGINRHLSAFSPTDIINGSDYKASKKTFDAVCKDLKRQGKGGNEHFPVIEEEDLRKMYAYFDTNDNTKLLEKVFVDIMIYFGRRGRENIRDLKVDDFAVTTDSDGNVYMYMAKDELTKNHQNDRNTAEGRMYGIPDDAKCPIKTFMIYKRRRNPKCTALFQKPSLRKDSDRWYDNVPLGHNTLGNMMPRISKKAGLSKRYTNHSLRATAVHILDAARIPSRHIMSVTGHKAESSLKTYTGTTDSATKKLMSHTISKKLLSTTVTRNEGIQNDDLELSALISDHGDTGILTNSQMEVLVHDIRSDDIDEILQSINTDNLVPVQPKEATKLNRTPVTNNALPNIYNYGHITINYNVLPN